MKFHKNQLYSFKKMNVKMSYAKWGQFCPGLNLTEGLSVLLCLALVPLVHKVVFGRSWWRHAIEMLSELLALCERNPDMEVFGVFVVCCTEKLVENSYKTSIWNDSNTAPCLKVSDNPWDHTLQICGTEKLEGNSYKTSIWNSSNTARWLKVLDNPWNHTLQTIPEII